MTGEELQRAIKARYLTIVADLPPRNSLHGSHLMAIESIGLEIFSVIPEVVRGEFANPETAKAAIRGV